MAWLRCCHGEAALLQAGGGDVTGGVLFCYTCDDDGRGLRRTDVGIHGRDARLGEKMLHLRRFSTGFFGDALDGVLR
jgi:hypothetical protein